MTCLDARALRTDPEGLELLRAVLDTGRRRPPREPAVAEAEHRLSVPEREPEPGPAPREVPADTAGWIAVPLVDAIA